MVKESSNLVQERSHVHFTVFEPAIPHEREASFAKHFTSC